MRLYEFLTETPDFKTLKKNKVNLADEERQKVMDAGATWNHGPKGQATPAVWKGKDSKGKMWFVCNTHRACQIKDSLGKAIKAYKFIKTTA